MALGIEKHGSRERGIIERERGYERKYKATRNNFLDSDANFRSSLRIR